MASQLLSRVLSTAWTPRAQIVRFRKRINIQRPAPPHFERAKVLAVCKPQYVKNPSNAPILCLKSVDIQNKTAVENPFEIILSRELTNWFKHSQFIAFLHTNPMKEEDKFKYTVLMKRQGMDLKVYGKAVIRRALQNTYYEPVLQLFKSRNAMVFSQTTDAASKLIKMLRKMPQITLMAGIINDRLLSHTQLEQFAALPNLVTAQSQLVSLLAGAAGPGATIVSQLNSHQQNLTSQLEQRIEQLKSSAAPTEQPMST